MIFFVFGGITGCGSPSLKLCVCDAAYPWSQSPSAHSQCSVKTAKFVDKLAVLNYHRDNLTVSKEGLVMFKGSRFLVPQVLRPGLLRALHSGHAGVRSMTARAKEGFWWPGISADIDHFRANCRTCHENAPSQAKLPSQGVFKT